MGCIYALLDPRFRPILMNAIGDEAKPSLVINLFENGFSFDDKDTFYNHLKSNAAISDSINYLLLPGQLEHLLQKTHSIRLSNRKREETDGNQPPQEMYRPLVYHDGGIIIEIRDYREGRGYYSETQDFMVPQTFKIYLKRDSHSLLFELTTPSHGNKQDKLYLEKHVLQEVHPDLYLEPSLDHFHLLTSLHYSMKKLLVPVKPRITKRIKSIRPAHFLRYQRRLELENNRMYMKQKASKLLNHLNSINFVGEYKKELTYQLHQGRKRKDMYNVPSAPSSKISTFQSPLIGRFLFSSPLRLIAHNPNEVMNPSEMMTIETKGAGTQSPFEIYHLILKVSSNAKPLHLPLGGPQTTHNFLNQFKKLEKPATKEQLRLYNEYLRSQIQGSHTFTSNPMLPNTGEPTPNPMMGSNPSNPHIPVHPSIPNQPTPSGSHNIHMNPTPDIKTQPTPYGHQRMQMTQRMMPPSLNHPIRNGPNSNLNIHQRPYHQVHPSMVSMPYTQNQPPQQHHPDVTGIRPYGYPPNV